MILPSSVVGLRSPDMPALAARAEPGTAVLAPLMAECSRSTAELAAKRLGLW
jgi:hypothetical protein